LPDETGLFPTDGNDPTGAVGHMPSHIFVRLGKYDAMIRANQKAIDCDDRFVKKRGKLNFYTIYRIHNLHFLTYGAMFDGQQDLAIESSRRIRREIPDELLSAHADMLDPFLAAPLHALIRFGKWEQILNEPKPDDDHPLSQSLWHYARGIAYAATNRVAEAAAEQQEFNQVRPRVPDTSRFHNNSSREVVRVAEAMLEGEIAYRRGEYDRAFESLRTAVEREDALNYDEPWGWMQPTRHALGALLYEQGRYQEAESVYRADLSRHPNNVWALQGLLECLEHRDSPEAKEIGSRFQAASVRSDLVINRACMCRQAKP
jgi:tetratricopeptide (TPR) repeat protein